MFNTKLINKLIDQIKQIELKYDHLTTKNLQLKEYISQIKWELENPPKYKVGDTNKYYGVCKNIWTKKIETGIISFNPNIYNIEYSRVYKFVKDNITTEIISK